MRAVVQRVLRAEVRAGGDIVGSIQRGLLVFIGVALGDTEEDARWMAAKLGGLRIFEDGEGAMNRCLEEEGGSLLLVSQFTLLADARKGRRPSFSAAAQGPEARSLYELVCELAAASGIPVERGRFGADMKVELVNDGPVTILLDSAKTF
ncbi:MAG TPA: D-aminoacyl-tRNA deacylase [Rectinemataceae bacterium]|nr:D-aminoacyl-tRNA deacylase [Rectinemataceae bacterium]